MSTLSTFECELLAFEDGSWKNHGTKVSLARERFGLTATRYYALLDVVLDKPAALAYDPALVARLRRLRDQRRAIRSKGPRP